MTIKAIADELGVSVATLYRRLKANSIDIKALRDDKTGELTAAGASVIADLFGSVDNVNAVRDVLSDMSHTVSDETLQDITSLRVLLASTQARLEASVEMVQRLDGECARLRAEVDRLTGLLEGEQRQRVQLLEDGRQRRGILARLFGR